MLPPYPIQNPKNNHRSILTAKKWRIQLVRKTIPLVQEIHMTKLKIFSEIAKDSLRSFTKGLKYLLSSFVNILLNTRICWISQTMAFIQLNTMLIWNWDVHFVHCWIFKRPIELSGTCVCFVAFSRNIKNSG